MALHSKQSIKEASVIEQLQMDAANPSVSVSALLRKAKIIASKLELDDFLVWINNELNGYEETISKELPAYRQCYGEAKAFNPYYGWQPITFEDVESREYYSYAPIGQSIAPLEEIVSKERGELSFSYSPKVKQILSESLEFPAEIKLILSPSVCHGILDAVRNSILEWALKLEKAGVTGEGLKFSDMDKSKAEPVTQHIFAHNIGNIGNINDSITINQTAYINSNHIEQVVSEIEKVSSLLPDNIQETVDKKIQTLKSELEKKNESQDKGLMAETLKSIRNICDGAAGSVVGQGIISLIDKLFI